MSLTLSHAVVVAHIADADSPNDPNLATLAELAAVMNVDSSVVSTVTSQVVSAAASGALDSAPVSTADSKGVSAGVRASAADSKAVSTSVNASVADSKALSVSANTSVADSKGVSNAASIIGIRQDRHYEILPGEVGVADTAHPYGHAERYGAIVGGAVDASAALGYARDSMSALGGGYVVLPVGTLLLNTGLVISQSNIGLRGAGFSASILDFRGTGIAVQVTAPDRVALEDFRITGTWGTGSTVGVAFDYAAATTGYQYTLKRIRVVGNPGFSIAAFRFTNSEHVYAEHCDAFGADGIGYLFNNASHSGGSPGISNTFIDCRAQSCDGDGWDIGNQTSSSFINCQGFSNNGGVQFRIRGTSEMLTIDHADVEHVGVGTGTGLFVSGEGHDVSAKCVSLATGISVNTGTNVTIRPSRFTAVTNNIVVDGTSVATNLLYRSVTSPAALAAGNNNDYAISSHTVLRLTGDAGGSTLTGIAGGWDGRRVRVINVAGGTITLAHQSGLSSSLNRILHPAGASPVLGTDDIADLEYDGTTDRWRIAGILQ